ncbi:class II aldolase/adducin family protein [Aestuariibius insulae]|uniref:class II aldolase/adducin family protein n=1 Tax=Aestuariibius insulae TaxID=2058287 RepID=UPI00345EE1EA
MTAGALPSDFVSYSAKWGADPLRIQGPGGNTSIKIGEVMWIKASGMELGQALERDVFVPVNRAAALAEAHGAGDGTCKAAVIGQTGLRPSIETTFHAMLDWDVVAHTHSVATIAHAISPDGLQIARDLLRDLPVAFVPYAKPGLPLTAQIAQTVSAETQVIVLGNHGLICCGSEPGEVADLMDEVERRLTRPALGMTADMPVAAPPDEFIWVPEVGRLALEARLRDLACSGSLYPDHVVFLGPGLPRAPMADAPVAVLKGQGVALRKDATSSQRAMLICLADVLARLDPAWAVSPIGAEAEAELLDWDAEKYRQALAARGPA